MSFLKKLFGGGDSAKPGSEPVEEISYKGFHIATTPMDEGGQYRVCALISKEVDGEMKTHKLIRADLCPTANEASTIALRKAQQMIDEQGMRLLS